MVFVSICAFFPFSCLCCLLFHFSVIVFVRLIFRIILHVFPHLHFASCDFFSCDIHEFLLLSYHSTFLCMKICIRILFTFIIHLYHTHFDLMLFGRACVCERQFLFVRWLWFCMLFRFFKTLIHSICMYCTSIVLLLLMAVTTTATRIAISLLCDFFCHKNEDSENAGKN